MVLLELFYIVSFLLNITDGSIAKEFVSANIVITKGMLLY